MDFFIIEKTRFHQHLLIWVKVKETNRPKRGDNPWQNMNNS